MNLKLIIQYMHTWMIQYSRKAKKKERGLPENVTLIGRIRKDSMIYELPENSEEKTRGRTRRR
ncbi:MAG: hypothetical protein GXO85_06205 [Chlorobi bacterium]|nr:hypothetical protein [Chlorobiota bacterium]